jgi:hypothetical protein
MLTLFLFKHGDVKSQWVQMSVHGETGNECNKVSSFSVRLDFQYHGSSENLSATRTQTAPMAAEVSTLAHVSSTRLALRIPKNSNTITKCQLLDR